MPNRYSKDRFDDLPRKLDRVGAHRVSTTKRRGWMTFWWALAATVLLISVGIIGLFVLNNRLNVASPTAASASPAPTASTTPTPSPTPSAPPTPEPTVDPSLDITVLNGTPGVGVARGVADVLAGAGWTVGLTADADSEDVPDTVVYYADQTLEGAARGVSKSIPGSEIRLSDAFGGSGADITVVIGNDYRP